MKCVTKRNQETHFIEEEHESNDQTFDINKQLFVNWSLTIEIVVFVDAFPVETRIVNDSSACKPILMLRHQWCIEQRCIETFRSKKRFHRPSIVWYEWSMTTNNDRSTMSWSNTIVCWFISFDPQIWNERLVHSIIHVTWARRSKTLWPKWMMRTNQKIN